MDRLKGSVVGKLMGCNIIDRMGSDWTQPFHESMSFLTLNDILMC